MVMSPSLARRARRSIVGCAIWPARQIGRSPLGRDIEGFQCRSPASLVALPVSSEFLTFRSDALWPSALMLGPTRRMQARASADRSRPNGSRGSLGFTLHSTPKARFRGRQRVDASAASGRDRSDEKRARVAATAFGSREVCADACEQHGVRGSRRHARARSFDRKERTAKALGELRRILGRRALPVFPASTRIELA